jgi:hypothetical protein
MELSLEETFQQVDDQLNTAYETNDPDLILQFLSDDWMLLEPRFGIITRERFLRAVRDGRLLHSAMRKEVMHVRVYDHIAIVVTRGRNRGQLEGNPFDAEQWVINTYRRSGEQWLCVFTQEAPVIT